MAERYLWRLSSVKVQAVRTFGISESHRNQGSMNIFTLEVQGKKPSSNLLALPDESEQRAVTSWPRQEPHLLISSLNRSTFTAVITATRLLCQRARLAVRAAIGAPAVSAGTSELFQRGLKS